MAIWNTVPTTYNTPSYTFSSGTSGTASVSTWATTTNGSTDLTPNSLQVKGKAEFEHDVNVKGDITVDGKSIKDSMERIEERLAILRPNEELEEKWEQLRGLRKMYMELEAEIIEKEQIWNILKK